MLRVLWPTVRPLAWGATVWTAMLLVFAVGMVVDDVGGLNPAAMSMRQIERFSSTFGFMTAAWAIFTGFTVTQGVWGPDEAGRRVYALTLPVSRGHYALLRLALGAIILSALCATQSAVIAGVAAWIAPPPPLQAYPVAISLRAWLTALSTFVLASALMVNDPAGRMHRAMSRRLPVPVVALIWLVTILALAWLWLISDTDIGQALRDASVHEWSPLRLILANWNLFDG